MIVVVGLLFLAVAVLAVIVFGLLRTHAEILRALDRAGVSLDDGSGPAARPSGPAPVGGPAPVPGRGAHDVIGTVPAGGPTKVSVTGVSHLTLLAFLSSDCRTCKGFWEAFAHPDLELPGAGTRLVIIGQDPAHDSEAVFADLVPPGVRAVLSTAAWQAYDVPGSPYFALVDGAGDRVIGSGSATSWEQMRGLLQQALGDEDRGAGRRGRISGRDRARRADDALLAAGIGPGHPSLHPNGRDDDGQDGAEALDRRERWQT